jgi:hypothetical protein
MITQQLASMGLMLIGNICVGHLNSPVELSAVVRAPLRVAWGRACGQLPARMAAWQAAAAAAPQRRRGPWCHASALRCP